MAKTKKKIILLVIGLLVPPLAFKGQCHKVKNEEAHYIIFPKAFFSSNADHVKGFLSSKVLIDDVTDKKRKSPQEPPLSPSSDASINRFDVEETTGVVSGPGVASESFTDNHATEQAMTSHEASQTSAIPYKTTASHDAQDTTRAVSCQELSPTQAKTHGGAKWYLWNNSYYAFVISSRMTWENAVKHCSTLHTNAHLVFIGSEQENRKVSCLSVSVSGQHGHWWIGINDKQTEGQWKLNDVSLTYTNWNRGNKEPNGNTTENCGELRKWDGDNALWNDRMCSKKNNFICETTLEEDA